MPKKGANREPWLGKADSHLSLQEDNRYLGQTGGSVTEVVMTMALLVVILGATDERAPEGLALIPIGLCLTLIHLISIPVTNTSVNPARSTGVAVYVGD